MEKNLGLRREPGVSTDVDVSAGVVASGSCAGIAEGIGVLWRCGGGSESAGG